MSTWRGVTIVAATVGVMTQTRSLEGRSLGMSTYLRLPEVSRLRLLEPGDKFRHRMGRTETTGEFEGAVRRAPGGRQASMKLCR